MVKDYIHKASQFGLALFRESAQRTLNDHSDDGHLRGFTSAADIALHCIQEKIDAFKEKFPNLQVSGLVTEVLVDYNSPVKSGQLIAKIDSSTYESRFAFASAFAFFI